eukprot:3333089-Alexandrium_andersonii.AAC.1
MTLSPSYHGAHYHDGDCEEANTGSLGPRSFRGAHSASLFALSANVAMRISPELPRVCLAWVLALGVDMAWIATAT